MAEVNFGVIYNLNCTDLDSVVSLSECSASATILHRTITRPLLEQDHTSHNPPPIAYVSDNEGAREVAILTDDIYSYEGCYLERYTVVTSGSPAINFVDETLFTPSVVPDFFYGVVKVSDSLYYVYYSPIITSVLQLRRISVTPGGGFTDDILQEITLTHAVGYDFWSLRNRMVFGKKGYLGLTKTYSETYGGASCGFAVYVYVLDMVGDSVSGGLQWSSGGTTSYPRMYGSYIDHTSGCIAFVEKAGTVSWLSYWVSVYDSGGGNNTCLAALVQDGTKTVVYDATYHRCTIEELSYPGYNTSPTWLDAHRALGMEFQYNANSWIARLTIQRDARDFYDGVWHDWIYVGYTFVLQADGSITNTPDNGSTTIYKVKSSQGRFESLTSNAAITYDSPDYWWADPTTGERTSSLSITGITQLYNLLPVTDKYDDCIYAVVRVGAGTYRLAAFNAAGVIQHYITITAGTYAYLNHGNFLFHGTGFHYILNMEPVQTNRLLMIPEQN